MTTGKNQAGDGVQDNESIEVRIARIDERIKFIHSFIKNHITTRLDKIDNRLWWILGSVIAGLVAVKIL